MSKLRRTTFFAVILLLITSCITSGIDTFISPTFTSAQLPETPLSTASKTPLPPKSTPEPIPPMATIVNTQVRSADGAVMVFVMGGAFQMGSTETELNIAFELCEEYHGKGRCNRSWFVDETPQHKVILDPFWIDQIEVTNSQYSLCVEAGGCKPVDCSTFIPTEKPDTPVGCVTWFDANSYCEWAGARLPTEAEWEYAARGPEGYIFPWGNTFDPSRLNYCDFNCTYKWNDINYDDGFDFPAPVGSFETGVSWCGAQDMAGNMWEWVADWYDPHYYAYSPTNNPQGPDSGSTRVIRGGSAQFFPPYVRAARRSGILTFGIYVSGGFRCAVGSTISSP